MKPWRKKCFIKPQDEETSRIKMFIDAAVKKIIWKVQWKPENSGIGSRLLDSIYDFKYSNEHDAQ